MSILNHLFHSGRENERGQEEPARSAVPERVSDTPDLPCPFGYKTNWITVRCDDPAAVLPHLTEEAPIPANWESGLILSGMDDYVFVTPPVRGCVMAVGVGDYDTSRQLLEALSGAFEDVQYFGSHQVVDYYCWARYRKGTLARAYCFVGESGEVLWNEGSLTEEEQALGFGQFPAGTEEDWSEGGLPDEESVTAIAGAWGVDPTTLEQESEVSSGYLCRRPV